MTDPNPGFRCLSYLPSLVLYKILKYLSPSFPDVKSFSLANRRLREAILLELPRLYHLQLTLRSGEPLGDKESLVDKPILSLKLTSHVSLKDSCSVSLKDPNSEIKKNQCQCSESMSCSKLGTCNKQINAFSDLMSVLPKLDLSNLQSLEIRNCGTKRSYLSLWKVLPVNQSIRCENLKILSVDVPLVNLSEIRDALINVVYQHEDFQHRETNIDYIINSAVSQTLYNFLIFVDDLLNGSLSHYGSSFEKLEHLTLRFKPETVCDWSSLNQESLMESDMEQLKSCIEFMIEEFKNRFSVKYGVTDLIEVQGIPNIFLGYMEVLLNGIFGSQTMLWPKNKELDPPYVLYFEKGTNFFNFVVRIRSIG